MTWNVSPVGVFSLSLLHNHLRFIKQLLRDDLQLRQKRRCDILCYQISGILPFCQDTIHRQRIEFCAVMCAYASFVQFVGHDKRPGSFINRSFKYFPYNGRFLGINLKILDRFVFLVQPTFFDSPITVSHRTTGIQPFSPHLIKSGFDAHGCLSGFAFALPVSNIIDQRIGMAFELLFAFFDAENSDSLLGEPLHHKGCFIVAPT